MGWAEGRRWDGRGGGGTGKGENRAEEVEWMKPAKNEKKKKKASHCIYL